MEQCTKKEKPDEPNYWWGTVKPIGLTSHSYWLLSVGPAAAWPLRCRSELGSLAQHRIFCWLYACVSRRQADTNNIVGRLSIEKKADFLTNFSEN